MRRLRAAAAAALLALGLAGGGCATVDTVKAEQGRGVKRTFREPYDRVFQAALDAAAKRKLALVEHDRAAGRIVLSHGVTWGSLGEHIAIFVSRLGERSTAVEIVSKPVFTPLNFPPDWPSLIFGDLEVELANPRRAR
jgi:hypothetical protein